MPKRTIIQKNSLIMIPAKESKLEKSSITSQLLLLEGAVSWARQIRVKSSCYAFIITSIVTETINLFEVLTSYFSNFEISYPNSHGLIQWLKLRGIPKWNKLWKTRPAMLKTDNPKSLSVMYFEG